MRDGTSVNWRVSDGTSFTCWVSDGNHGNFVNGRVSAVMALPISIGVSQGTSFICLMSNIIAQVSVIFWVSDIQ